MFIYNNVYITAYTLLHYNYNLVRYLSNFIKEKRILKNIEFVTLNY